jgi:hypothetical protein
MPSTILPRVPKFDLIVFHRNGLGVKVLQQVARFEIPLESAPDILVGSTLLLFSIITPGHKPLVQFVECLFEVARYAKAWRRPLE